MYLFCRVCILGIICIIGDKMNMKFIDLVCKIYECVVRKEFECWLIVICN